jgi:(2Fe-2S) ferredoxin
MPNVRRYLVTVCQHRSCARNGAEQVLAKLQAQAPDSVRVSGCECQGQCGAGPTVRVTPGNVWYCQVKEEDVEAIATEHLASGTPVQRLLNPRMHSTQDAYADLAARYRAFVQEDDD